MRVALSAVLVRVVDTFLQIHPCNPQATAFPLHFRVNFINQKGPPHEHD